MTRPAKAFAACAAVALLAAGCASNTDGGTDADSGLKSLPVQTSIDVPADAVTAAGDGEAECADGTTIGYAGAMTGPNFALYREAAQRYPQIAWQASGGVRDVADLHTLSTTGAAAAISGRALLEKQIRPEELCPFLQNA